MEQPATIPTKVTHTLEIMLVTREEFGPGEGVTESFPAEGLEQEFDNLEDALVAYRKLEAALEPPTD